MIDASAFLALLQKEPGSAEVAPHLSGGKMSAANAAEVATKLADSGLPVGFAAATLEALGVTVVAFDAEQAWEVGRIRPLTKSLGLSLGDRACLGLGLGHDEVAVTADRTWAQLPNNFKVLIVR